MKNIKIENIIEMLIVALAIITFVTFIIFSLLKTGDKMAKEAKLKENQKIEECKAKTSDVEWCYRQFYKPNY